MTTGQIDAGMEADKYHLKLAFAVPFLKTLIHTYLSIGGGEMNDDEEG